MLNLLKKIYSDLEALKGRKLLTFLLKIFVVFIIIGFIIGYINVFVLNKNELPDNTAPPVEVVSTGRSFTGRVVYIDPMRFKDENISYALYDSEDKEIILLSANDKKLEILEGLTAEVRGKIYKAKDGKSEVLRVSEVIMHATN